MNGFKIKLMVSKDNALVCWRCASRLWVHVFFSVYSHIEREEVFCHRDGIYLTGLANLTSNNAVGRTAQRSDLDTETELMERKTCHTVGSESRY